jgi:hypothetical protein
MVATVIDPLADHNFKDADTLLPCIALNAANNSNVRKERDRPWVGKENPYQERPTMSTLIANAPLIHALQLTIICCLEALTGNWDRTDQGFVDLIDQSERALASLGCHSEPHSYEDTSDDELARLYPTARLHGIPVAPKHLHDHAFDIAFSLRSNTADGSDVTAARIRSALLERLASLTDAELLEAAGAPFDSYETL